jgi:hypothetical protein
MDTARSFNSTANLTFRQTVSTTESFQFGQFSGGLILVSSTVGSAATVLTFYAKPSSNSQEFYALHDASNSPITITVQPDKCYELPKELFGASTIAATVPTGQSVTCKVYLKS